MERLYCLEGLVRLRSRVGPESYDLGNQALQMGQLVRKRWKESGSL
ncbi:MAG: hypothetical protein ABIK62_02445 [candidate division WOR-3 bacterium]